MITKTEVERAILENEKNTGWGALDHSPTTISRGDLFVLIEAAKNANYEWQTAYMPKSKSELVIS